MLGRGGCAACELQSDPRMSDTAVLPQIRAEMSSDNERLRSQLAARNADITALLDRAAQYERQSRAAQDELEAVRQRMHAASVARSELEAATPPPDPPARFDHVPGQPGDHWRYPELVCLHACPFSAQARMQLLPYSCGCSANAAFLNHTQGGSSACACLSALVLPRCHPVSKSVCLSLPCCYVVMFQLQPRYTVKYRTTNEHIAHYSMHAGNQLSTVTAQQQDTGGLAGSTPHARGMRTAPQPLRRQR